MSGERYKKSENGRAASATPDVAVMTCGDDSSVPQVRQSAKLSMNAIAEGRRQKNSFYTFKAGMLLKINGALRRKVDWSE
jgi:hypothetical protein